MKAAVLYKPKSRLVVDDVVFSEPQPNEVVVKIATSGVCYTDLHQIETRVKPSNLPMVLGHEGSGVVEAVNGEVTLLKPGDHVVLTFSPSCGKYYLCTLGRPNLCVTPFHEGDSGGCDWMEPLGSGKETTRFDSFLGSPPLPNTRWFQRKLPLESLGMFLWTLLAY